MKSLVALVALVIACQPTPRYYGTAPSGPPGQQGSHYLSPDEIAAIPNGFPTTVMPPQTAEIAPMHARMTELGNPEKIGQLVSTLIALPDTRVNLVVAECGDVDAHYNPNTRQIRICYEIIAMANRLAGKPRAQWYVLDQEAASFVIFIALHEIGHALVDVLDLRFQGNEEDLVDQFAFLVMSNVADVELAKRIVRAPAAFFYHHGKEVEASGGHRPGAAHSPSGDRAFEALCLFYGRHRDPGIGQTLGKHAQMCEGHARDTMALWNQLLRPYTRLDTGNTFQ